VLERQLDMVQTGLLQARDALLVQADARRQQVRVVAQPARFGDEDLQVVALQRFAARESALHGAEGARLAEHAQPILRRQFGFVAREVDRVVAEHAVQRTAIGQLGQQPQRRTDAGILRDFVRRSAHANSTQRRSCAMRRNASTSASSPVVAKRCSRSATIASTGALPLQRVRISPALPLSLTMPSGYSNTWAC